MQVGDVLVFGELPDGGYIVMGRRGTKEDTVRKASTKRVSDASQAAKDSRKAPVQQKTRQAVESLKTKRIKQKQATQQVWALGLQKKGARLQCGVCT